MRKISTFSAILILLFFACQWASAQLLIENFNYTTGDTLGLHWAWHSGTAGQDTIQASPLTYTGYASSGIGKSVKTNTGATEDLHLSFPDSVNSGTVYASFLVNVSAVNTTGDYFFHFGEGPFSSSDFGCRLSVKTNASSALAFGLSKASAVGSSTFTGFNYSLNTTYLVVVKYMFEPSSTTNDSVALYVFTDPTLPATEPSTATIGPMNEGTTDLRNIGCVAIRQGTAANVQTALIAGIRVSTKWSSSVGGVVGSMPIFSNASFGFGPINVGSSKTDTLTVQNLSQYNAMNISAITSSDPTFAVTPTTGTVPTSGSQKFFITYSPTAVASNTANVVFVSDDPETHDTIAVTGSGIQAGFSLTPKSFSFGNVWVDSTITDSVTVTNLSTGAQLSVDSIKSSNPLFTVGPANALIAISSSTKFGVSFKPLVMGADTATIVFYNNGALKMDTLKVTGNGIVKAPLFSATPTLKDFHVNLVGHAWKDSIKVKNTGYDSLKITGITSSDASFAISPVSANIDSQATKTFFITFTPSATGTKFASVVFTSNDSEVRDTVKTSGTGILYSKISEARKDLNNDSIPDHSVTGDTLIISGVITSKNLQSVGGQTAVYIQDSTAGVEVFGYALPPVTMVIGDSVFAIGVVEQYHGLTEFYPLEPSYDVLDTLHLGILKHNATVPKPKHLTYKQYVSNSESYEGLLVEIDTLYKKSGTWPGVLTSGSIYLTTFGGKDSTQMYISSSTDVAGSVEPQYPINVVAVISQYSSGTTLGNGYEIEPSDSTNIIHTKFAPLVKISEARKDLNNDQIPDHSVTKDTLMITGVVTSPNLQATNTAYFVQDSTGGVEVFAYGLGTVFVVGDSVAVVGTVAQYHGLDEFTPLVLDSLHFALLKHKAVVPKAKRITLLQYVTNGENYEGLLIEIDTLYKASGTWPAAASASGIYLTDKKGDTAQVYINASTDIGGSVEPKYPVNVFGIGAQYSSGTTVNNGYEILPRDTSDFVKVTVLSVIDAYSGIPTTFMLENNYPNPFNPSTTILYGIAQQSHVTVKIYSVLGQEIATLVNTVQGPSYYRVVWDGKDLNGTMASSGVYFFRIIADPMDGKTQPFMQVKKMLLMK
ncbi:MAG: choice-of-anchor D domain-containing protein [Bacteroidota bacterium]